jgi:hypothetical protein
MHVERMIPFTDMERAQLEASAAKVQILRGQMDTIQAQARFLALAIPHAEGEHGALLERIKTAHATADCAKAAPPANDAPTIAEATPTAA